jgi:hypothetical protein
MLNSYWVGLGNPISGSILPANFSTSLGSDRLEVGILWFGAQNLLRMGILAPKPSNTRTRYFCSLFFKLILMIRLRPPLGSGGFRQLGIAAEAESCLRTGDDPIICRLLLISDVPALGSSARDCFRLFTPQIYTGLPRASLGSSENPLPPTGFPKFSFPPDLLSQ